jgi:hypothetical protein
MGVRILCGPAKKTFAGPCVRESYSTMRKVLILPALAALVEVTAPGGRMPYSPGLKSGPRVTV